MSNAPTPAPSSNLVPATQELRTIWRMGPSEGPSYVKYDVSGTLINQDKFNNFGDYFWTGVSLTNAQNPSYNDTGRVEYTVIEAGGTTDWSVYNTWSHVSTLQKVDLHLYVQAVRPIIEFNVGLESALLYPVKTAYGQLPKFRLYIDDPLTGFNYIPWNDNLQLNDAYAQQTLLARLKDLSQAVQASVLGTPEVLANCFLANGDYYIQSLVNGEFVPTENGVVYGYIANLVQFTGAGNGSILPITAGSVATPEVITLTYNGSSFTVVGTVSGAHGNATVDVPYMVSGISFTPAHGSVAFVTGDQFVIEIKSYIYNQTNLYVPVNGAFRTYTAPDEFTNEIPQQRIVPADVTVGDGVWEVPPQLYNNILQETRDTVSEGDLYYHFTSIIAAQDGLTGFANGDNNYRDLPSIDYGVGGSIKQFDGHASLLFSILMQQGLSLPTLIDFARERYDALFSSMNAFLEDTIPNMLSAGLFIPPLPTDEDPDAISPVVFDAFMAYFSVVSPVVTTSSTQVDDYLAVAFHDTTSSFPNLIPTLPYLGLSPLVQPVKMLDQDLNLNVLVHHDGHETQLMPASDVLLKKIVMKPFLRSEGQQTPGVVTGASYPTQPYQGQFWYKAATGQLFFYNVVTDNATFPTTAVNGAYAYDRNSGDVYQYNGTWNLLGNSSTIQALPWYEVRFDLIAQNLGLAVETYLYNNCPGLSQRISAPTLQNYPDFNPLLQQEFEAFGVTYGTADVYSATYDPANAFTWNYSGGNIPTLGTGFATWQTIYGAYFGTSRPDLQPWIALATPLTESVFLTNLISLSLIPGGTTDWSLSLWTESVWTYLQPLMVNGVLPVNPKTGALLPPYGTVSVDTDVATPQQLFVTNAVPNTANSRFKFGDLGPVELYWTKTTNYLYSLQKVYFKLDPLDYVYETWGIRNQTISEYELDSYLGRKAAPSDFMLHGDLLPDLSPLSWCTATLVGAPDDTVTYTFECVSRIDKIFKVTGDLIEGVEFFGGPYYNPYAGTPTFFDDTIAVTFNSDERDFFYGDIYTVVVTAGGIITESVVPAASLQAEGFNQIYVEYGRLFGEDSQISINKSLLQAWTARLGYRMGGLIATDTLQVELNDTVLESSSYDVLVKETPYIGSYWLDGIRVQVAQIGSSTKVGNYSFPAKGATGQPGDDWVFRIDNFNSRRPQLSWYTYDTSSTGQFYQFTALNGQITNNLWNRYQTVNGTITYAAPFLVVGIQNLINFINGYADMRAAEGWLFNISEDPILDTVTGRPVGYQLLIEKFITSVFSNVQAGAAFAFTPFQNKCWFQTATGVVADLFQPLGLEQETVCTILDENQQRVSEQDIRVFRNDDMTEFVFDDQVFTLHILINEYEHTLLFNNYSASSLIYDPFLGQSAPLIFLDGEKSSDFTGKLDFQGYFLLNDTLNQNIETSIQNLSSLYDSSKDRPQDEILRRSRALLGFQKSTYFAERGTPDGTEFRFWQGMISNKGTNKAVVAFTNSASYLTSKLDELWAYRVATYGNSAMIESSEIKIQPDDTFGDRTTFLFLEADETATLTALLASGVYGTGAAVENNLYSTQIYPSLQNGFNIETIDVAGAIPVVSTDESRWFSYEDLNSLDYFQAKIQATYNVTPYVVTTPIIVLDTNGNTVAADCFELIDLSYVQDSDGFDLLPYDIELADEGILPVYREIGDYIPGTNPPQYTPPKFVRLNHTTIMITDPSLLAHPLQVVAYGPDFGRYSPETLYNYVDNSEVASTFMWWDPARGQHDPYAIAAIDYRMLARDPALYNVSNLESRYSPAKTWGAGEVGKLWWNGSNLSWKPYYDTRIFPTLAERLGNWGALADYSNNQVFEWVQSTVPPAQYVTNGGDGEPALNDLLYRTRTWQERAVAFRFSENPAVNPVTFLQYNPSEIELNIPANGVGTIVLKELDFFDDLGLMVGDKINGAAYASPEMTDASLLRIFGQARITGAPTVVIGSAGGYDDGPLFSAFAYVSNLNIQLDTSVLSYRGNALGQYQFDNDTDASGTVYLICTQVSTGTNQRIAVSDSSPKAGQQSSYVFDNLGITLNFTINYGQSDSWPGIGVPTQTQRIAIVADSLGNTGHQVYLRSSVPVLSTIPFIDGIYSYPQLYATTDAVEVNFNYIGWIASRDPTYSLSDDLAAPYQRYIAVTGNWIGLNAYLYDLSSDITTRQGDPWISTDGSDWQPYQFSWSSWVPVAPTVRQQRFNPSYTTTAFFSTFFSYPGATAAELLAQTTVYVSGIQIPANQWEVAGSTGAFYIQVLPSFYQAGMQIRAQFASTPPTPTMLAFDPDVSDPDPTVLIQYNNDAPYVVEYTRNVVGGLTGTTYYYWVKNKASAPAGKTYSIIQLESLLTDRVDPYTIPGAFKYYNELDGRPNRYSMLTLRGLSDFVDEFDTYKLRLTSDPTMRDDDENMTLKNVHEEWILINTLSTSKIPKALWDTLTDTICGVNALGQALPFNTLAAYDQRNSTSVRYGLGTVIPGQVMCDQAIAQATLKYTILNTQLTTFINGVLVPDYISYDGFDSSMIDTYLSTPTSARSFMANLWRFADTGQVNELFFQVLQDCLVVTSHLDGLFKTSWISLNDVRTINSSATVN
jgi:hypothetical protein